eukprot:TRINITY_DN7913_c1_g1_i1.p1 TRINITY_DN7913_c1_g1~~TRINITY_DN7913_c1_g1_i1.p1  ORF type:complete len:1029 (-),score=170.52 TRINITY_DN7913_c1_g1_i1:32-3118(-)
MLYLAALAFLLFAGTAATEDDRCPSSRSTGLLQHKSQVDVFLRGAAADEEERIVHAMRKRYVAYFSDVGKNKGDSRELRSDLRKYSQLLRQSLSTVKKTLKDIKTLGGRTLTLEGDGERIKSLFRYQLPDLALTYRLMKGKHKRKYLSKILAAYRQVAEAGINGSHFEPQISQKSLTVRETLAFEPTADTVFLRLEGGFGRSLALLHDELDEAGLLSPNISEPAGGLFAALRQKTRLWEANTAYMNSTMFDDPGLNTDASRILITDRLAYCLCLESSGDSSGNRSQHFGALKEWLEKALALVTTPKEAFKVDGDLQGHAMFYGNAYPYHLLPLIAEAALVLEGTPWALSKGALHRTAHALHVQYLYTVKGASPRAVGGRLVPSDRYAVHSGHWCASIILSSLENDAIPKLLQDRNAAIAHISRTSYDATGSWGGLRPLERSRPGCIRLWHKLKSRAAKAAATALEEGWFQGTAVFPYAGLALLRAKGWMAAAKCYSKEVKNSFEANSGENLYGFYQGAGSLTLLSEKGFKASGLPDVLGDGFDWFRFPGTTALTRNVTAERSPEQFPRGKYASDSSAFCGGVQDTSGSIVAWGFAFEDLRAKANEMQLSAKKSVFVFNRAILALGSNISLNQTETTLFQTKHDKQRNISLADRIELSLGNHTWVSNSSNVLRLHDGLGNAFVVPNSSAGSVKAQLANQYSYDYKGNTTQNATWLTAVLEHDRNQSGYEYIILMNTSMAEAEKFEPSDHYEVLAHDASVHAIAVHDGQGRGSKAAAVFYAPSAVVPKSLATLSLVASVSVPCSLVVDLKAKSMTITIANPKLGWLADDETFNTNSGTLRELSRRKSKPQETKLRLARLWQVASFSVVDGMGLAASNWNKSTVTADTDCAGTDLRVTSWHGQSVSVSLQAIASSTTCTTTAALTTTTCQPTMQSFLIGKDEDAHLRCNGTALKLPNTNGAAGGRWGGLGKNISQTQCQDLCLRQDACDYAVCWLDDEDETRCQQCSAFSSCNVSFRQSCCEFKLFKKGGC